MQWGEREIERHRFKVIGIFQSWYSIEQRQQGRWYVTKLRNKRKENKLEMKDKLKFEHKEDNTSD
jgi:hypothetical protein